MQSMWPKDIYQNVFLKFECTIVDIILEIDPSMRHKVMYINKEKKNKRQFFYGELNQAVYGTTLSSVLFYQNLSSQLEKCGSEVNPFYFFTFNRMENGTSITIQFHVDQLKISHVDEDMLEKYIKLLNN